MNPTQEQVDAEFYLWAELQEAREIYEATKAEIDLLDRRVKRVLFALVCVAVVGMVALRMAGWR